MDPKSVALTQSQRCSWCLVGLRALVRGLGTWAGSPFQVGSSTLCPDMCHSVQCPGAQSMEQRDPQDGPSLSRWAASPLH